MCRDLKVSYIKHYLFGVGIVCKIIQNQVWPPVNEMS